MLIFLNVSTARTERYLDLEARGALAHSASTMIVIPGRSFSVHHLTGALTTLRLVMANFGGDRMTTPLRTKVCASFLSTRISD